MNSYIGRKVLHAEQARFIRIEAGTVGKTPGQLSRFGGAAENKDACHACF